MKKSVAVLSFLIAAGAPALAPAATVDPSMIPDGTYVVKVERVADPQHATVMMQNGMETTLVGKPNVDFSRVKPNDTIKISLIKGTVPVYALQ